MHVDVDTDGVELEEQHVRRLAAVEQHVRVRLLHRVRDAAVTDAASVDVQVLLVGAGARIHRLRDPAVQAQARGLVLDAQRVLRELLAQRPAKALTGDRKSVVSGKGVPARVGYGGLRYIQQKII